ncbi:MAG: VWA domain-containing protein [Candidatus Hydrothermae bacterium]|nr:VWA domain-containing protein [Candidatus Hydrothermae bacterium]
MRSLTRSTWMVMLMVALGLTVGCTRKEPGGGGASGAALQQLFLLGVTPYDSTGTFQVSLVGISDQNEVVDLRQTALTVTVDSISYAAFKDQSLPGESRPAVIRVADPQGSRLFSGQDSVYQVQILGNQFQTPTGGGDLGVSMNFDNSGSLSGTDPNNLRIPAAKDFIRLLNSLGNPNDLVGVFGFSRTSGDANGDGIDDYYFEIMQDYTQPGDTAALFAAIDSLTANALTPLWCSLVLNMDYAASRNWTNRRPVLVSFTDGGDNDSYICPRKNYATDTVTSQDITVDSVIAVAQRTSTQIFFVALSYSSTDMQTIASQTGGLVARVDSADALQQIFRARGYSIQGGYNQLRMQVQPLPPAYMNIYLTLQACSGGQCRQVHIRVPAY